PTRGGLASVLHEILSNVPLDIILKENSLPFSPQALAISSMLGIDLLHVACEGRLIVICDPSCAEDIVLRWQILSEGKGAVQIGHVERGSSRLILETLAGGKRLVDVPQGELLPRIC
ncbi:MAG: hydrogenase expression/formation protein HypE, partial [SAR324 cluster bacterium]|nr:hydrogenase expression/formation protein HypE [SAR324 cluster bacterium]